MPFKKGEIPPGSNPFPKGHKLYSGEKNGMWRGDSVGYSGVHRWVRSRLPEPELCQQCGIKPPRRKNRTPLELANITGVYTRAFENWKYLCPKCHYYSDKRKQEGMRKAWTARTKAT